MYIKGLITIIGFSIMLALTASVANIRYNNLKDTYKAIEILMEYQYQLEKEQFELLAPYNYTETIDTVTEAQVIWAKNTLNVIGNNYCKECDLGAGIQPCY